MNFFINYEGNYEEQRIVYFKKVLLCTVTKTTVTERNALQLSQP